MKTKFQFYFSLNNERKFILFCLKYTPTLHTFSKNLVPNLKINNKKKVFLISNHNFLHQKIMLL